MPDTSRPRVKNLVYFASGRKAQPKQGPSQEELRHILETVGRQAVRERAPDLKELESILQDSLRRFQDGQEAESQELDHGYGSASITKMLQDRGYLRDKKKWLTDAGFLLIGSKILKDALRDMGAGDPGLHETRFHGDGDTIIDTTKRFEPGDDISYLNVPITLLNSVLRLERGRGRVDFPVEILPEDLEESERLDDVRTAIVYCIDLSSTMRYNLADGMSRIEAAKRALWSLYALNRRFFPSDSVSVVGFASMASVVKPRDIPYLKTYDAGDGFLHYTNYQGALRLAGRILRRAAARNRRIVLITDGQPSACFVENEQQKSAIVSEKPYSNFYSADDALLAKVRREKDIRLDARPGRLVYLCYRYRKVDARISHQTLQEAKRCLGEGISIDSIVISDETELLDYIRGFEAALRGRMYHIQDSGMSRVLIADYISNTRRILRSTQNL